MKRVALAVLGLLTTVACYSPTHETITREQDPALMVQTAFWMGLFWIAAAIGATIILTVWVICYYRYETQMWKSRRDKDS